MRYTPEHKAQARQSIVKASGAVAKKSGFGTTGIDELMQAAGLTSGAFYKHFDSKDELLEAITSAELERSLNLFFSGKGEESDLTTLIERYLSRTHLKTPDKGCILPTLSVEIGRAGPAVRKNYEQGILALHAKLTEKTQDTDKAWACLAMCMGGLTMARAVHSTSASQTILTACFRAMASTLKN